MRKEVQRGNVIISHARALITFYTHNHGRHHVHSFALRDYRSRHLSKAAAKEIGKIKKVNVAKKVAKKPPICLNCGIGGHNKLGFLCESIKNVIGLGDMQKQSNN